jgi:hypothetical protein
MAKVTPPTSLPISPLIAAGSRFPVGSGEPDSDEALSPVERRSFLLRGAESVRQRPYTMGATPKTTSSYDGTRDDESEEFNQPDFSP